MMNKRWGPFVAAVIIVTGCSRSGVQGDGVVTTEKRPTDDFSQIVVEGAYQIHWSCGKPALNLSADQNLLPLIKTSVSDHTLKIGSTEKLAPSENVTITLSSASLSDVQLNGGNSLKIRRISAPDLKLESNGATDICVEGIVTNLQATLTGASKLKSTSLQTQNVTLSLVGASDADVTVSGTLKVSITGAGSLTYRGNPESVEKHIVGTGRIRQRP